MGIYFFVIAIHNYIEETIQAPFCKICIKAKAFGLDQYSEKHSILKMEPLRKSISFQEIEERESSVQENLLRDMFASASTLVLNSAELEYEETQPSALLDGNYLE